MYNCRYIYIGRLHKRVSFPFSINSCFTHMPLKVKYILLNEVSQIESMASYNGSDAKQKFTQFSTIGVVLCFDSTIVKKCQNDLF